MSVIGQYIKKFRTAKGITQEQLGQLVGVSTQAVSKWECGGTPDAQTRPWARIMHDSNVNYTLLAYVVEQVSGMAYEDYIRQNIFEPLGMTHSGFSSEAAENPQWGLTYENLGPCSDLLELLKGCGDIVSTAGDMDIWMTALQSGKVVCEESYRQMTTSYSGDVAYRGYGYGLMVCPRGSWGHGGDNGASNNYIIFNSEYGYNIFIATSSTPEFLANQVERVTVDFVNILFKAVDAAAQQ